MDEARSAPHSAAHEASSTKRDDLSMELLEPAMDPALRQAVKDERGRRLLDRLVDEVTSGHVSDGAQERLHLLVGGRGQGKEGGPFLRPR